MAMIGLDSQALSLFHGNLSGLLHERVIDGMPLCVRLFDHQPMVATQYHIKAILNLWISIAEINQEGIDRSRQFRPCDDCQVP